MTTTTEVLDELERLRKDAARWAYVRREHVRAHSLHMDGTCGFAFRSGIRGRWRTIEEAIDAAILDGTDKGEA